MYTVVFITCSDKQEANKIADVLITGSLAACVNIIKDVRSIFKWEGKVEQAEECLLIVKTKEKLLQRLIGAVKKVHKYKVPEIIALPILDGNKDYLAWIDETTL